jgi:hypothetical protein
MRALICAIVALAAATPTTLFAEEAAAKATLKDYTCWDMLTEPEEQVGQSELFYLAYALGQANRELADEAAYKQVVADVIARCQKEPDLKVLEAFTTAIKKY